MGHGGGQRLGRPDGFFLHPVPGAGGVQRSPAPGSWRANRPPSTSWGSRPTATPRNFTRYHPDLRRHAGRDGSIAGVRPPDQAQTFSIGIDPDDLAGLSTGAEARSAAERMAGSSKSRAGARRRPPHGLFQGCPSGWKSLRRVLDDHEDLCAAGSASCRSRRPRARRSRPTRRCGASSDRRPDASMPLFRYRLGADPLSRPGARDAGGGSIGWPALGTCDAAA